MRGLMSIALNDRITKRDAELRFWLPILEPRRSLAHRRAVEKWKAIRRPANKTENS